VTDHRSIIVKPVITEKAGALKEASKYVFRVERKANKIEIRRAVEAIFKVHVESVRTVSVPSKPKRQGLHAGQRAGWKKAYVTLRTGETIEAVDNT
jgi:large subunit ribosomal protein L23